MNAPVRVLWLTKGLGRGGTERLLVAGARHFDRTRFEIEVAYLLPWKDALVEELEAQQVSVRCLGTGRLGAVAWIGRLRRLVRSRRYDIIHTHMPYPAVVARLVLGRRGPAFVHTEHNLWQRYRLATQWANALTYSRNAAVLAVSQGVAESIRPSMVPDRRQLPPIEILLHGIELEKMRYSVDDRQAARARLGLDDESLLIGTVGNLTAKKGHRLLIEALARLAPDHPTLRGLVVGSGPLERELRRQLDELALSDRVVLAGSRPDVPELLPAFDVFVLSSIHEGLPLSLLEAMASGVACVATRVGGVPEVVEDGRDGLLVPPNDVDALVRAISRLLQDLELRGAIGASGRRRSAAFDLATPIRRIQEVYEGVVAPA